MEASVISTADVYEHTKSLEILFVEDDSELLKQMTNIFKNLFNKTDTAPNGEVGLKKFEDKLKNDNKAYDLVISDINMPVMNGIDMIKNIYQIAPHQPVIVTSAHSDAHYLIDLLNIGVNGFLIKPLEISTINNSLYSVSKAINNESLVKRHFTEIENLNQVLSIQSKQLKVTNDELRDKNIALEKSMRIIESLNRKQQLEHKNGNKSEDAYSPKSENSSETSTPVINEHLDNIKDIISEISMKYHRDNKEPVLLKKLSNEINMYITSIANREIYSNLINSLKELSTTVSNHPEHTTDKELHHIFDMLESFFFIYTKLQNELINIDDSQFQNFSNSIEGEIHKLIKTWN